MKSAFQRARCDGRGGRDTQAVGRKTARDPKGRKDTNYNLLGALRGRILSHLSKRSMAYKAIK